MSNNLDIINSGINSIRFLQTYFSDQFNFNIINHPTLEQTATGFLTHSEFYLFPNADKASLPVFFGRANIDSFYSRSHVDTEVAVNLIVNNVKIKTRKVKEITINVFDTAVSNEKAIVRAKTTLAIENHHDTCYVSLEYFFKDNGNLVFIRHSTCHFIKSDDSHLIYEQFVKNLD